MELWVKNTSSCDGKWHLAPHLEQHLRTRGLRVNFHGTERMSFVSQMTYQKLQQECFMGFYLVCMMDWFIWTVRVHLYSCVLNWAVTVNGTFEECTLFRLDAHDDSASKSDPCIAKGAFIDHYILHVVSGYAGFTLPPPKSTKEYDKFLSLVSSARKDRWMMLTISTQTFRPSASLFANEHC